MLFLWQILNDFWTVKVDQGCLFCHVYTAMLVHIKTCVIHAFDTFMHIRIICHKHNDNLKCWFLETLVTVNQRHTRANCCFVFYWLGFWLSFCFTNCDHIAKRKTNWQCMLRIFFSSIRLIVVIVPPSSQHTWLNILVMWTEIFCHTFSFGHNGWRGKIFDKDKYLWSSWQNFVCS